MWLGALYTGNNNNVDNDDATLPNALAELVIGQTSPKKPDMAATCKLTTAMTNIFTYICYIYVHLQSFDLI